MATPKKCVVQATLDLFIGVCDGAQLSPVQTAQLQLISESVAAHEPGNAHMVELVRCALAAAVEVRGHGAPDRC
jgi:hypothetical protein